MPPLPPASGRRGCGRPLSFSDRYPALLHYGCNPPAVFPSLPHGRLSPANSALAAPRAPARMAALRLARQRRRAAAARIHREDSQAPEFARVWHVPLDSCGWGDVASVQLIGNARDRRSADLRVIEAPISPGLDSGHPWRLRPPLNTWKCGVLAQELCQCTSNSPTAIPIVSASILAQLRLGRSLDMPASAAPLTCPLAPLP